MRKMLFSALLLANLVPTAALALDASPALGPWLKGDSLVEPARVFCYDRRSGYFLHWGYCSRPRPRVYCQNRYSGAFLHWGAC